MSKCKIQFYSMEGCGYCAKAKTMFAKLINDGVMCVLPHGKANAAADAADLKRPTGFPFFIKKSEYNKLNDIEKQEIMFTLDTI